MLADSSSTPRAAASVLLAIVGAAMLLPLCGFILTVAAQVTGGPNPPLVLSEPDPISDGVAATAAEFRVDESGAATYAIKLYSVPGTAGVAPQLTLSYSSQAGQGPLGKGWRIEGVSAIARCRSTREAGDFLGAATPDGTPRPVNFSDTDRYCLDGQRLVPSSATCPASPGMAAVALGTELDRFSRVCAYQTIGSTTGPAFFTVEGKDGSLSWYGDRDTHSSGGNRPDGYLQTTSPLGPSAAITWAQTRFQDSTGNYIDYKYFKPSGTGEIYLKDVRFTGKLVLAGQSVAVAPYAKIQFNYSTLSSDKWQRGYLAGGLVSNTQRLESITSCATADEVCATASQARHIILTYATAASGSGANTLVGFQECRDSSAAVCAAPTAFAWSQATNTFDTIERPAAISLGSSSFKGYKMGDLNGDGRQDLVYLRDSGSGCLTGAITPLIAVLDGSGIPSYSIGSTVCLPTAIGSRGDGAWHLLDYDGDGRDDLFVSAANGQAWRLYPSNGATFNTASNLISGLSPIIPSNNDKLLQPQLADVNGDGLADVIYTSGGAMRVRVMERQGLAFSWGAERTISVDEGSLNWTHPLCTTPGYYCHYEIAGMPTKETGFSQLADFNGDASSDILINVNEVVSSPIACMAGLSTPTTAVLSEPQPGATTRVTPVVPTGQSQASGPVGCIVAITPRLNAFTVQSADATSLLLRSYGSFTSPIDGVDPGSLALADVNGDGLTDVFYRFMGSDPWRHVLNTGTGFQNPVVLDVGTFKNQTKFVDVNGDGLADIVYPTDLGAYKAYSVKRALPAGGFEASGSLLSAGNARICEGSGCNVLTRIPLFTDIDADGNTDFVALNLGSASTTVYVSRPQHRFTPRDVIARIVNGFGAQTEITYAPMTNASVYVRDAGTRNSTNWGRGSPVMDMLAPLYVVAKAASSSPVEGSAGNLATLHYRYAGAKVQAGGRGFLGFREVTSIDSNQSGGHVVTTTSYAQNYPFAGLPIRTQRKAVIAQTYIAPSCLSGVITNACFGVPGQSFPSLGGALLSDNVQSWESLPASLGAQTPLHVRLQGTEESTSDPYTAAQVSKVVTAFTYANYGNVAQTAVDTYSGASTLVSTQLTNNTYTDDVSKWRLGRLTGNTVTHRRPGKPDVVRTTGFNYAMSGAATGLLTEERIQPGGAANLALTTAFTLDDFGNRTQSTSCANPASSCSATGLVFRPSSLDAQRRYTRTEYDASGRFPVAIYQPFWNGSGAEERRTSYVVERNIFGEPTNVLDVNNVRTVSIKGLLGRDYFSWQQTSQYATPGNGGAVAITNYRWCGSGSNSVECPIGAVFRRQSKGTSVATEWIYFDALGREILAAEETLNVGVSGKDISAVCKVYDQVGRIKRVSNPFFLAGVGGAAGPTGLQNSCAIAQRDWTTTSYDILGRVTSVLSPDGSQVSSAFNGLTSVSTDKRGNPATTIRNGKGEVVSVQDATGFLTNYAYSADGNIASMSRDAGNGAIVSTFTYDALGRRTQQTDPDSGTTTFEYNSWGEPVAQADNGGYRVEREIDARGRAWRLNAKLPSGVIESQSTTEFDNQPYASGQPTSLTTTGQYSAWAGQTGTALGYSQQVSYDALGRALSSTWVLDEGVFSSQVQYDQLGRVWKSRDATGMWSKVEFGARGPMATCASDGSDASATCSNAADTYTRTAETDQWGHVVRELRAGQSSMEVRRQYHPQTGRITQLCVGAVNCALMKEDYVWDAAGNLASHQKEGRYLEQFTYDALNRVTEGKLTMANGVAVNQVLLANAYDQLGNICSKDGLGYQYPGADGCVGALPMPQSSGVPLLSGIDGGRTEASSPLSAPSFALNRSSYAAPESSYSRFSPSTQSGADAGLMSGPITGSPHAVSQVGTAGTASFFYYDDRGNQTLRDAPGSASDRTISYTADSKAHEIAMGNGTTTKFWYGPEGKRYKRQDGVAKTLYIGDVEILIQNGVQTARRYAAGVALQLVGGGIVQSTKYLFYDHLGSLVKLANPDGSIAEALDYASFGSRRAPGNPSGPGASSANTPRGFTGQESRDGSDVIHMNGRIYDSKLGRFLQPDPLIQEPMNGQSWNAYTYAFNNPLVYTDPSGNFNLRQAIGLVIVIVAAVISNQYWIVQNYWAAFGVAVAGGFAAGAVATGTFKGGLQGAFTAAITFGAAYLAKGWDIYAQMAAQAVTGGITETLQGGKFGHGFATAGITALFMPGIAGIRNDIVRTATGSLLGGTLSLATGGKFANGAIRGGIQAALAGRSQLRETRFDAATPDLEARFEDAPAEVRDMLTSRDPAVRQEGIRATARLTGRGYLADSIFYEDRFYTPPDRRTPSYTTGAVADGSKITFFIPAFRWNYTALQSILEHEMIHWWQHRLRGWHRDDPIEVEWREMQAYKYQVESPTFARAPLDFRYGTIWSFRDHIVAYRNHLGILMVTPGCAEASGCKK